MKDLKIERLESWSRGKEAPPLRATIIITNRCDLNCLFCRGRFSPKDEVFYKDELTSDEWIHVAEEGVKMGIKEWGITGGEPLIRSDAVVKVIESIKNLDSSSRITLTTNGSFLDSKVAKRLVYNGCDVVEIGIDGPNAVIHDFLRGSKGSFKKATCAVKFLSSIKKKLKKDKPYIIIKTVLNSKNYDKIEKLVLLTSSLGGNCLKIIPMRIYDENKQLVKKAKLILNNKQKKEVYKNWEKIEKLGKNLGIKIEKEFSFGKEEVSKIIPRKEKLKKMKNPFFSAFCYIPFYSLVIDGKGNAGPCSSIPPTEFFDLPNLRKENLRKIWYEKFFNSIRKKLLEGKPISEKCKSCGLVMERENIVKEILKIKRK
jgi:pyrroloquinoline quinone biosynthesis protein E